MYVLTTGTHLGSGCAGQLQGKILETLLSLKAKTCEKLKRNKKKQKTIRVRVMVRDSCTGIQ